MRFIGSPSTLLSKLSFLGHHQSTVIESIDVWSTKTNSNHPRYTLAIVDTGKEHLEAESGSCNGKFGVFIVPKGKDCSWILSVALSRS